MKILIIASMLIFSRGAFATIPGELASPWTTSARPWLLSGAATTGLLLVLQKEIVDPTQKEISGEKPLGQYSVIGDYGGQLIPNVLYAGGMGIAFWSTGNRQYADHAMIMIKASTYALGTSFTLKFLVHEKRPNNADYFSFPSGHATAAFAFAGVVTGEHGFWPYGFFANALASFTALSRINDNKHWLHDVVAGATIGTVFGLGVSEYNQKKENQIQILPIYGGKYAGLMFRTEFK